MAKTRKVGGSKSQSVLERIRRGEHVPFGEIYDKMARNEIRWADLIDAYDHIPAQRAAEKKRFNAVVRQLKAKFEAPRREAEEREMMERENDAGRMVRRVERAGLGHEHMGAFISKLHEIKRKEERATKRKGKMMNIEDVVTKAFEQTKRNVGIEESKPLTVADKAEIVQEIVEVKPKAPRLSKRERNALKAATAANTKKNTTKKNTTKKK